MFFGALSFLLIPERISSRIDSYSRKLVSPVQRSSALNRGIFFRGRGFAALHYFWEHLASMAEKVYFEFEAEIQGKQTHFLIEVDKETEDPELRAEDFIHLQHLAEIKNMKGPKLLDAAYAEKLRKIEPIATHRDGKVWIVQKP